MNEPRTYHNPVQRGFFPDPSVIRVGDDYYMVNSSFQYFPAIPISHSRDMVHWHIIGHAITNPEWLDISDSRDSHGCLPMQSSQDPPPPVRPPSGEPPVLPWQ